MNKKIPCFGVLGNLILNFSKILNQKASHEPSGQHVLNEEYYDRIEAIQFTMNHDDGNLLNDIEKSDIILVGVSRTSKTPTSIYLANKGFKTSNIPLVNENSLPKKLKDNPQITCVVGLNTEAERLVDLRKNRMNSLKETENTKYTSIENIKKEIEEAKKTFRKYTPPCHWRHRTDHFGINDHGRNRWRRKDPDLRRYQNHPTTRPDYTGGF